MDTWAAADPHSAARATSRRACMADASSRGPRTRGAGGAHQCRGEAVGDRRGRGEFGRGRGGQMPARPWWPSGENSTSRAQPRRLSHISSHPARTAGLPRWLEPMGAMCQEGVWGGGCTPRPLEGSLATSHFTPNHAGTLAAAAAAAPSLRLTRRSCIASVGGAQWASGPLNPRALPAGGWRLTKVIERARIAGPPKKGAR